MTLADRAAALVGHRVTDHNRDSLDHSLARTAKRSSRSKGELVAAAEGGEPAALRSVIEAVTIRETYFLRHPDDFELLGQHARRRLAERQPIRWAWSVGCSTGEEAYSIAAVLASTGTPASVIGCDVNLGALEVARAARYERGSLRDEMARGSPWLKADGASVRVSAQVREQVAFVPLNLVALEVPPPPLPAEVDVIFCRNVLMYLEPHLAARVLRRLSSALAVGGLMVLGALEGEPSLEPQLGSRAEGSLRRVHFPASNAWVRDGVALGARSARAIRVKAAGASQGVGAGAAALALARVSADQGLHAEAIDHLEGLGDDPRAVYLSACVRLEQGDAWRAETLFRQVLMLEPDHIAARLQLFLSASRVGDAGSMRRERELLDRIVSSMDDTVVVNDDGLTARKVRQILAGSP
jgi:chemotaxis protein methyltransferase CheR